MARNNNSILKGLASSVALIMLATITLASVHLPTVSARKTPQNTLRVRRNVRDLYDMMTSAGLKTMKVAEVLGYGRFCGMGNSAAQQGMDAVRALAPLDAIDACCKVHDLCYDNLSEIGGKCRPPIGAQLSSMMRYLTPYYMEQVDVKAQRRAVIKGRTISAAARAEAANGEFLRCKGYDWSFVDPKLPLSWIDTCGVALCGCDYTFAKCLKENEGAFNRSYLSTRSLVDQASDQFGPAARHSLELLRTSTTIGQVHSNVMNIFDFISWFSPKKYFEGQQSFRTATTGTQTGAESAAATVHEAARRTQQLNEHHETASAPWSLWG